MGVLILLIFFGVYGTCLGVSSQRNIESHQMMLGTSTLRWTTNYKTKMIHFEIHADVNQSAMEWFGVGFSANGELAPSDMCVLWTTPKGLITFQDSGIDDKGIVSVDRKQNCNGFQFSWSNSSSLKFSFEREFDTCDYSDYKIEEGTTHIVWMKGMGPINGLEGLNILSAKESGFQRTTLLYYSKPAPDLPSDVHELLVHSKKTIVPSQETTYWCTVSRLKLLKKRYHIVRYEKIEDPNSEPVVHHMELFHCATTADEKIPDYSGPCEGPKRPPATRVCKQVIAAWAMGAPPFVYPEDAGLPIGGPDYNPYVMLEMHYHNPELRAGIIDTSGFRLFMTPTLRKYDAGLIELGLEYNDKMAIPPDQKSFLLRGFCLSECTSVGLPSGGIKVFGSQLHTHLTGIKVYTKHVREGVELPELNRDNHYSQHMQEIRRLKHEVTILPGDALITTCEYRTTDRQNVTLTGFAITDEMCVNYIHYYPDTDLEVCKSSIPTDDLYEYFNYMAQWEGQKTSKSNGISDNYKAIEWNKRRVRELQRLYLSSPISMQCNKSSGERFPGGWEGLPPTRIVLPLPPKRRRCGLEGVKKRLALKKRYN